MGNTFEDIKKLAEQGDAAPQNNLGVAYRFGEGVDQSDTEAVKWFKKAAEQGHVIAQFNLGNLYWVEQDYTEAVEWFMKAAEQGDAEAQCNLGVAYLFGEGVDQSDTEAVKCFKKAAEQGLAEAQNRLGVCYRFGKGVVESDTEAVKWFKKAAEQGLAEAQHRLGVCYHFGKGVVESDAEAIDWYRKAADHGLAVAQRSLGVCYRFGKGVEQNDAEAIEWYRKAAEQGLAEAQCNMGNAYYLGRGVEQSDAEAIEWYRKAADQGLGYAQYNLAVAYGSGRGVEQSDTEAIEWCRKAADQGLAVAQCSLGIAYYLGRGAEQCDTEAVKWYRKAADQGDTKAQYNLGYSYVYEIGVSEDLVKAKKLFEACSKEPQIAFESIEMLATIKRKEQSPEITEMREQILELLKLDKSTKEYKLMTHYTSLDVGNQLFFKKSPFRLNLINGMNDPDEGKILWRFLEQTPIEGKPIFIGCFLPESDSLSMWRFYSKNHVKDDACGCSITFEPSAFFDYNLLNDNNPPSNDKKAQDLENRFDLSNTGKTPSESSHFYRIVYVNDKFEIFGDENEDEEELKRLFHSLKNEVEAFINKDCENGIPEKTTIEKVIDLLGPLPYLVKNKDYKDEQEHRIIVSHLSYGAEEIQVIEPDFEKGTPAQLYLELHREKHLAPVKHITLGPKAPNNEMLAPYWNHLLNQQFGEQIRGRGFNVTSSTCMYK